MSRFHPPRKSFHCDLSGLVRSRSESLPRIDADRKTILRTHRILPARNDKEIIGDGKARVRLLPLFGPVAILDDSAGNGGTLLLRILEDGPNGVFDFVEIGTDVEIEDEA